MPSNGKVLFIIEVALFSAIAVLLDLFSISAWGQGGSVSLQMLPIFIMSFRWGWKGGLTTGFIFGLLQLITGAYIIHPLQAILDYPLAFTAVGSSAVVAKYIRKSEKQNRNVYNVLFITLGCFIGSFFRLIFHNISAIIYFSNNVPDNQPIWIYATIYNMSYIFPSFLICVLFILVLIQSPIKIITFKK